MNEVSIRKAVSSDYQGVSALMDELHRMHVEARPDIYRPLQPRMSQQEFEDLLSAEDRYLYVAEATEQGGICGYVSAQLNKIQNVELLMDREVLYINEIIIDPKYRGRSIGQKMMAVLVELGKELQADHLELTVASFNQGAQEFYEKLGLVVRSSRMEYIL
ncbi:GNAT family N-acetyltransferase [Paenibacillus tundrae]|uniref:Ribosomal protein S18 acetylase RimI-like enzyme n=1 Tax=Paenibacillus tundrae TaxID=528187 RepID=A0ABT9WGV9_9BACL|nr:GNAT family N-acetyltransferase [Paenibacillus tundrae]MDQ0172247.1 ribosomal protein S18 acetylase RimI-like enzyme [Paenibacillus tundrae]